MKDYYKLLKKISVDEAEIWAPIENCGGYFVSNYGRVFNVKRQKLLLGSKTVNGYWRYTLRNDFGKKIYKYGHKLAAEAFLPNPDNKENVFHLDENKTNNYVGTPENDFLDGNLIWATQAECNNLGTRNKRVGSANSVKINQYDLEGNFIKQFNSLTEAATAYGITSSNISVAAQHKYNRKTAGGYIWKYAK